MKVQTRLWLSIILIVASVSTQDVPINPNDPYNPSNGSSNNYNPYSNNPGITPDPLNPYDNDNFNRGGNNDPNRDNLDPYGRTPYDPLNPYGGKDDQFGRDGYGTNWKQDGGFGPGRGRNQFDYKSAHAIREATYFIVAPKVVRPGQLYRVAVTVLKQDQPMTVRAAIQRNGVELTEDHKSVKRGIPETLLMRVPPTSVFGEFKLRVEGYYDDIFSGISFVNETKLIFSQRSMTIFIQSDKPVYKQGETVNFRTIPINTELKAFDEAVDVFMLDPNGHIMKRWLSRQSNLGTVSLNYQLSDQPVFGEWRIRVIAQNQIEESSFLVEEYYQTRYEVNVTMPAFFFDNEEFIYGTVMANYTSGGPVRGNLTLKAIVRPIRPIDASKLRVKHIPRRNDFTRRWGYGNRGRRPYLDPVSDQYGNQYVDDPNAPHNRNGQYDNPDNRYDYNGRDSGRDGLNDNRQSHINPYGAPYYEEEEFPDYVNSRTNKPLVEKYFNFDEKFPFWMKMPEYYWEPVPTLKYFYGVYHFRYPIKEILHHISTLEGMEVVVVATVGDQFLDEVIEGYSIARVFNASIKLSFLGGSPQVFKPGMPITTYIAASFHDGSPLPVEQLTLSVLDVSASAENRGGGGRRDLERRQLYQMDGNPGIWEYKFDMRDEFGNSDSRGFQEQLNQVGSIRIQAQFKSASGQRAQTELLMLAHHNPNGQHIKVFTSTQKPAVGEDMIFHIKSNFYIRKFNYILIAKGIVLVNGDQDMNDYISTMAIPLSAEMAPVATIIVWHLGQYGNVVVDSMTFPVNGISRNKFKVFINNKKARTGHKVEVAIYGEPGSYVGLSGIDRAFFTMQAGNELTYAKVLSKMATFDEHSSNGTHRHTWFSHEGNPDEIVFFPSSTYGIDANRTFEYAGLVVFTDFELPRRWTNCNASFGLGECLNGQCYQLWRRCDFVNDCDDGTDESGCRYDNGTELALFRKYRFNRIQRQYENVWVWKDVNIGPHGRYIFNIPVPARPVHWMVSAFSMSPSLGFGMLNKPIEYIGVLPFFINVEMPSACMQGEQVGVRVTIFNYMTDAMEATVLLNGSPDYKFVHVEENGVVRSYNPRTSHGEHQFFIYIKPQDATVVYIPIVPTRLGDIEVTIHATTLIGKDTITRQLHVEPDGLPQHRHQSMLLDLSNRAYAFQYMHVNVTEFPVIPYEYDRYYVYGSNRARISVVGDVVGPIFPTMPVNATSLLHLPMDSAEQNMFSFAANMYTTLYMRYTQQRNKTLEKLAFHYMNIGYQRQLSFMQPDGSFSTFRSDWNQSRSSVWLTAYCARVFQEASFYEWENYIYIDPVVISKAVEWVLQHQDKYGAFYESAWLPDRKYNSTLNLDNDPIRFRNIGLTAHVLVMLDSVKDLTSGLSSKVAIAQKNAVHWIERNMDLIKEKGQPFDVAIVAYALMKSKAPFAETAFLELSRRQRLEGGLLYWGRKPIPQPPYKIENQKPFLLPRLPYEYDSENIEATSYALMVYVTRQEIYVDNIVRWLNTQRLTEGGWASTSDTANALKALIEYTSAQRIRDISALSVTVEATSLPGKTNILHVNDKNRAKLQFIEIPNAWGTVKVQAKGVGYAILQMHVTYNVDIARFQTKPPVEAFDLWTRPHFFGRNMSHISFLSCQRWTHLSESDRSGLAVLDVTIPTGYIVQQQDLDSYILSRRVRNLQRARFTERKVLFYFDYLDNEEICVNFTVERWYPVANMSRYLPIRIYDYYAPERFNETIFDALSTYVLDICHVCGSSQCPYCWIYNAANAMPRIPLFLLLSTTFVLTIRYLRLGPDVII